MIHSLEPDLQRAMFALSALTAIKARRGSKISAITFEKCGCSLTTVAEQLEMWFEEEKNPQNHCIIDVDKHRSTVEKRVHTVEKRPSSSVIL